MISSVSLKRVCTLPMNTLLSRAAVKRCLDNGMSSQITTPASEQKLASVWISALSPDDVLLAYAERRAMGGSVLGTPALPAPAANYNGTGMHTLYSTNAQPHDTAYPSPMNRKSLAPTEYSKYDDEDAYVGTAE